MRELLDYGGPILWLQAVMGFFVVVFVVERILYFHSVRMNSADFLRGIANHIQRKAFAEASHESSQAPGPISRVTQTILIRHKESRTDLSAIAEDAVRLEVPRIEKNMRALLGIAVLAPMAGLLGTVLGLIDVFMEIDAQDGHATHAGMAGGIFEALVTSAAGLAIATAAYLFYLAMLGKGQRLLYRLERTGIEVVNLIIDSRAGGEIVSFREKAEGLEREKKGPAAEGGV